MLIMNDLEQKVLDRIMDLQKIIIQKENDYNLLKAEKDHLCFICKKNEIDLSCCFKMMWKISKEDRGRTYSCMDCWDNIQNKFSYNDPDFSSLFSNDS